MSEFSEGILAKDFQKVNSTHNLALDKLKNIILPKLKYSVDLSALKYSTIITKNNYEKLLNKLNYQYNKIKDFININYTEKISNAMNDFLNSLNNTASFTNVMNNIGFNKIIDIYDKFQELINGKLSSINTGNNKLNDLINIIELMKELNQTNLNEKYNNTYNQFYEIVSNYFNKAQQALNKIEEKIKKPINNLFNTIDSFSNSFITYLNIIKNRLGPEWNYDFIIWLGFYAIEGKKNTYIKLLSFDMVVNKILIDDFLMVCKGFEFLQVRPFIYLFDIGIHLDVGLNLLFKDENKYLIDMKEVQILVSFGFDVETYIQCQAGLFIPIGIGEMYIAFGLDGISADINFHSQIDINLIKNTYSVALKFNLDVVAFFLYLKIGFYIDLKLFCIRFDFYLWYI